jgi:hypothetical protein
MAKKKPTMIYAIDALYTVSVYLAKQFQSRRLKCEKLTDDRLQVMATAHMVATD